MSLMPADVQSQTFREKYKGYDVEEVDRFLDEVTERLAELLAEREELLTRLEQQGGPGAAPTPATRPVATEEPPVGGDPDLLQRTLLTAQRAADQTVADARSEADDLLARAHAESERLVAETERASAEHQGRVQAEAERVAEAVDDLRRFRSEYRQRVEGVIAEHLALFDRAGDLPDIPPEIDRAAAAVAEHAQSAGTPDTSGSSSPGATDGNGAEASADPSGAERSEEDASPWADRAGTRKR